MIAPLATKMYPMRQTNKYASLLSTRNILGASLSRRIKETTMTLYPKKIFIAAEGYSLAVRPRIVHVADNTAISYISTGPETPAIISSKVATIFANIIMAPIIFHILDNLRLLNQTAWIIPYATQLATDVAVTI